MLQIGTLRLDEHEVAKRKAYLELTGDDERLLREAHPHLQRHAQTIIDRFYEYLTAHEHTRKMLEAPGQIERLKALQAKYFSELTAGCYDLAYCENRVRVGLAHHRIGLSPEWYLGAYVKYLHIASGVLSEAYAADAAVYYRTMVSLTKAIYLDMGLALDAYHFSAQERLEAKSAELSQTNQELKRLQSAKQQLADMIVHDLQNPLTGIHSALQILLGDAPVPREEQREVLKEALRRCDDLSQMILNVLQVSRAESGELQALPEDIELVGLVRGIVQEFQSAASLDGRSIELEGSSPLRAKTDPSLIKRIVQNLLRNALRHTPRETRVTVRVEPGEAGRPRIRVIDEGAGIPRDLQARLFEPAGAAALRVAGRRVDTGLGLPSCRVMARALGAEISVESDGQKGSTFTVLLPENR